MTRVSMRGVAAVLLDIEGTTTPLAFVGDVLFPYARTHLRSYLERHWALPACDAIVARLRVEHVLDAGRRESVPPWVDDTAAAQRDSTIRYVEWLMDRDRKSTPLKALQGLIWEEGYATGRLVGAVFDDVPRALRRWLDARVPVGIFSSGSVLAQRLLFGHSSAGDLTPFIQWHFDTEFGSKTEEGSYRRVAQIVAQPSASILFVSDVARELDAARAAGLRTCLSMRPGNIPVPEGHPHAVVHSFDELELQPVG